MNTIAVRALLACLALSLCAANATPVSGLEVPASASVFERLFPRPTALAGQTATLLPDGRWLLLGGVSAAAVAAKAEPLAAGWMLDVATRRAAELPNGMLHARAGHTATLLPNGQVLILGGTAASGTVPPPELYDPGTGTFALAGDLGLLSRSKHAATLLANGKLLITGGLSERGVPLVDAELFDAIKLRVERFNARSEAARIGHLSHLLPSEAVLLIGGFDADRRPVANAEMYDVGRLRFEPLTHEQAASRAKTIVSPAAPFIIDTFPAANSRDVAVDQVFVARLSKRMLVSTMNADTVTLVGPSGAVPTTVVPAESGLLVFVTPKAQLLPASTYTLFIKGATDESGQAVPFTAVAFKTVALAAGQTANLARSATEALVVPAAPLAASMRPAGVTPLPLPLPGQGARASVAPAMEDEDWLAQSTYLRKTAGLGPLRGDWTYATPFAGTQREYFKHLEDRRAAHHAELLRAPAGTTAVSGTVKRANGQPISGVTLSVGPARTETDAAGRFLLTGLSAGDNTLVIEGSTANRGDVFYGSYLRQLRVRAGETLLLDDPIFLTRLDPKGTVRIPSPTTREVVVTTPSIPGLEIRIPAGTVIRDRQGNILTAINISPVPIDRAAFPMPVETQFPVYFTVQPSGAFIQSVAGGPPQTVKVIYPNYGNQPAGTPINFWAYDPQERGWHAYGTGQVGRDGKNIQPGAGVGFYQFTGFSFGFSGPGGGAGGPCGGCCQGGAGGSGAGSGGAGAGSGGSGGAGPGGSGPGSGGPSRIARPGDGVGGAGSSTCGDPVLIYRGTFLHTMTDLVVNDVMPLALERSFMDKDTTARAFGVGSMHNYDLNLHVLEPNGAADPHYYANKIALIQPNGIQIAFDRVLSNGAGNFGTVWEHNEVGPFYKAVIKEKQPNFELTTRDGRTFVFYGHSGNKLQAIIDRNGNTVEISRSPAVHGRVVKVISPHGRFIEFTYNSTNEAIETAKDNAGRTVRYEYEAVGTANAGRLKKVTLPDGGVWQYKYTPAGRVEEVTNPLANRMVLNEYDSNGRVKKQTYADNSTLQIAYTTDSTGKVTQADITGSRGFVRRVLFDGKGYITQSTLALGQPEQQTTSFARDAQTGQLLSSTDALGRTTRYEYDRLGNVKSVTRLHGTQQAAIELFTHESLFSQLRSYTDSRSHTTTFEYDAKGNLIEVKDANNNRTQMTYDGLGRLLTQRNPLNHVSTWAYAGPDLLTVTDPLSNVTQYSHDALGRLLVTRDALGNQTEQGHDAMDRPTEQRNGVGGTARYEYDTMGNLRTHRDENGNPTVFTPNAMNQAASRRDALLASDARLYDAGGNLVRFTDRKGQVSGRRFDALNRVTFVGYGATVASPTAYTNGIRYTWDAGNRLTRLEDGTCAGIDCTTFTVTSTINRVFDGFDRLTKETTAQGEVNYSYYSNGLRQTMTVAGQPVVTYSYDDADRLRLIQQAAGAVNGNAVQSIGFEYDAANRLTKTTLANGVTMNYGYDNASRLTSIVYKRSDGSVLGDLAYAYDSTGRRTGESGSLAGTTMPTDATSSVHNANNQVTAWAGAGLSYDPNGNLVADGAHAYGWNSRNLLTEVRQGSNVGPLVAAYTYDATGRRTSRSSGGATTGYLYDGWNVVQELNGAAANAGRSNYKANVVGGLALDARYLRIVAPNGADSNGPKNPANPSTSAPLLASLVTDAIGSTRLVTKADQAIQGAYVYEAYGQAAQTTPVGQPPSDNPYQFTGRESEAATASGNLTAEPFASLLHYRHRHYSPKLRRFLSEDPIDFAGGANLYAYVAGSPIVRTDPTGESWVLVGVGVGVGIMGFGIWSSAQEQSACQKFCAMTHGDQVKSCGDSYGQDVVDASAPSRVTACKAMCAGAQGIGNLIPSYPMKP